MKVSCLQDNLAKGLGIVGRAVSTRSTLPVLANVLMATDDGRLKLSATNLEVAITCWIGAKVETEGAITVPARTINDLVAALPPEQVAMSLTERTQTLRLACGRTVANVKGIDAQEFPIAPQSGGDNRVRLDTGTFRSMINQVAFAAAADDTRPTLTGVSTRFEGQQISMVATDGFRLSMRSADLPEPVSRPAAVIVPARALSELSRILGDDNEAVYVTLPEGRNQIIFEMANVVLVSQLIEGAFPDFQAIVPRRFNTQATLTTADFRKACKTVDIFARESNHSARIMIEPGSSPLSTGYATVAATSVETGDNEVQLDAAVEGGAVEVAFNVKFLSDVLNVIDTPQVILASNSPVEPGVLRPVGKDDFTHVIMPMHSGR